MVSSVIFNGEISIRFTSKKKDTNAQYQNHEFSILYFLDSPLSIRKYDWREIFIYRYSISLLTKVKQFLGIKGKITEGLRSIF